MDSNDTNISNVLTDDEVCQLARQQMQSDRFATELVGAEIVSASGDEVVCSLQVFEHHRNAVGVVMGGVLFSLADFAAAVCANIENIKQQTALRWVTSSSEIHFLAPARGVAICACCRPVKRGSRLSLFETDIVEESRESLRLLARITTSCITI